MVRRYDYGKPALPEAGQVQRHRARHRLPAQEAPLSGRALRRRLRIILCGLAFLCLFGLRLLSPSLGEKIDSGLLRLVDGGWDYKEVLTQVGSFASEDGLQAVMALFQPEKEQAAQAGPAQQAAARRLREEQLAQGAQAPETQETEEAESGEALPPAVSAFLESQAAYAELGVPEDARFDMPELGLACVAPVTAPVTDSFGWRLHPLDGAVKFHYGVDLGAAESSDIGAFAAGTVYATGDSSSLGLYVILDHGNGVRSQYAHCQEVLVNSGDTVQAGQTIAKVGSSGQTTGPHLHFSLEQNGKSLNPAYYVDFSGGAA